MGKKIYNIEYFKNLAKERNGECLSDVYIACDKKLNFKCHLGHVWKTKPYYLINNNSWCPQCNKSNKDNIGTFHEIARNHGGVCLSDVYVNCRNKLKFKCNEGHIWESKAADVKQSNVWCPICSNSKILTIELMREIAESKSGKCLSVKYINSHSKLLWECEYGHQWFARPYLIKNSNHWCPMCNESKGETKIRKFLNRKNINYIKEKKFNDCKGIRNPLRFDFYLPDHNILIEYDGKQHFELVNFFKCSNEHAEKTFSALKLNDQIKNEYCITNNIHLIRIPYTTKNVEELLENKLKLII